MSRLCLYVLLGLVSATAVSFVIAGYWFYDKGRKVEQARQAVLIEEAREEERAKVQTVIEYRDKIEVVYRDKIKYIKSVKDSTQCADIKYTDMGFGLHPDR